MNRRFLLLCAILFWGKSLSFNFRPFSLCWPPYKCQLQLHWPRCERSSFCHLVGAEVGDYSGGLQSTPMQFLIKKVTKSLDLICRWQCFSGVVRKVISTLLGCRRSWIMYRIHTWPQPITLTLFWSGMRATYLFAYWIGWRSLTVNATEVRSGRRRPGRCI